MADEPREINAQSVVDWIEKVMSNSKHPMSLQFKEELLQRLLELEAASFGRISRPFSIESHIRSLVVQALTFSEGNRSEAGRLLGVSRDWIGYRITCYGLSEKFPAKLRPKARIRFR